MNKGKKDRKPQFWGLKDQERLTCTDPDEVIEACLEDADPECPPKTILICGFVPMDATLNPDRCLDDILCSLDEEYGDSEGEPTNPTEAMKRAMQTCCDTILKDYISWACEQVCSQEVNVQEWIKKNRPDWLEAK